MSDFEYRMLNGRSGAPRKSNLYLSQNTNQRTPNFANGIAGLPIDDGAGGGLMIDVCKYIHPGLQDFQIAGAVKITKPTGDRIAQSSNQCSSPALSTGSENKMDLIGLEKGIKLLNEETIPALVTAVNQLVDKADTKLDENVATLIEEAHRLLDRLDGLTVTFHLPSRLK
jgi:hypothetical protein